MRCVCICVLTCLCALLIECVEQVAQIGALATRLELRAVRALLMDSRRAGSGHTDAGELAAPAQCHAVLLDPPCSGLGQRPRFEDLRKAAELEAAAAYQHELMAAAMRALTRRSMLVYSTCSVSSCAALWQPAPRGRRSAAVSRSPARQLQRGGASAQGAHATDEHVTTAATSAANTAASVAANGSGSPYRRTASTQAQQRI